MLPIRTTLEDIDAICGFLVSRPTGATVAEMKTILDKRYLDGRKISALRYWGVIEDDINGKVKITERGRKALKESGPSRSKALGEVIRQGLPYSALVERVMHGREETITATDVAAYWHEHFRDDVGESDRTLNDQAVCFFQIAQGAELGTLTRGRKGMPTRFDFDIDATRLFVEGSSTDLENRLPSEEAEEITVVSEPFTELSEQGAPDEITVLEEDGALNSAIDNNRVFLTHGKNLQILDQVKELVEYGKNEPVIAMEHETSAQPVPQKVMNDMRTCKAAVIHVSAESVLFNQDGDEIPQINQNVLIEIGAAMALYGDKFVLLVEEGVNLPSNLQGLYECRYQGSELNMTAVMKLLKAFREF